MLERMLGALVNSICRRFPLAHPCLFVPLWNRGRSQEYFTEVSAVVNSKSSRTQRLEFEGCLFEQEFHDKTSLSAPPWGTRVEIAFQLAGSCKRWRATDSVLAVSQVIRGKLFSAVIGSTVLHRLLSRASS